MKEPREPIPNLIVYYHEWKETFCKSREGKIAYYNKVGFLFDHIKSITVRYYPENNPLAMNCCKMRYSSSKKAWECEIDASTKGYYKCSYEILCVNDKNYEVVNYEDKQLNRFFQ